jgi:hypothetical protein
MRTAGAFVCDCGTRLTIVTEGHERSTAIPCPTGTCNVRHIVSGEVHEVFMLDGDGKSVPYDWKAPGGRGEA